jgi:isopenicillin N synthase-like dioxygenase
MPRTAPNFGDSPGLRLRESIKRQKRSGHGAIPVGVDTERVGPAGNEEDGHALDGARYGRSTGPRMSVMNQPALAVIDIAGLRTGDPDDLAAVAAELGKAARDNGFCYVIGHGIPDDVFDGLLEAAKRFFALSTEEKMSSYIGLSRCHRGYVPPGEERGYSSPDRFDRKEAFDTALDLPADDPEYLAGNPMLGPNIWPDLPGFAEAVTTYYTSAIEVGQLLLGAFGVALGEPPEVFTSLATRTPSQLRLIHYPHGGDATDTLGIGPHTDFECFTLLKPTAPGLEVMTEDGEWVDAPPVAGALVLNIGDILETWTNGTFVATSHRVRQVDEERYSFPLFVNVDYDTVIEPLEQFRTSDEPRRRPLKAGEHLFAQTAQVFQYLQRRIEAGELTLPDGSAGTNEFGQLARQTVAEG